MSAPPVDLYAELVNSTNPNNRLKPVRDLLNRRVVRMSPFRATIPASTTGLVLTPEYVRQPYKIIPRLNNARSLELWPEDKIENEKIMTQIGWAATTIPDFEHIIVDNLAIAYGGGYVRMMHVVQNLHHSKLTVVYYNIQFLYATKTPAKILFDLDNHTLVITVNQESKVYAPIPSLTDIQIIQLMLPELVV